MARKKKKQKKRRVSSVKENSVKGDVVLDEIAGEIEEAVRHHQSGQFRQAEDIYKKILETYPNHSDALHLSGLIAHQTGKYEAADGMISKAIQNSPDNPVYHNSLGAVYKAQNKPDEAILCFQKALVLKPDFAQALSNLASAFNVQGRSDEAISCFQKVVQLKPDDADAYVHLGLLFQDQGRLNEAISCYENTVQIKPNHAETYLNLGNLFKKLGHFSQAISYYQRASELKPDYAEACNNMGLAFQNQGKFDEAISCYQSTLKLKPDIAETYDNMGNALQYQGKFDEAISCYQKALELKPEYAEAYSHLVVMLQQTCAWQAFEEFAANLDELTKTSLEKGERTVEMPLASLMRHADPHRNLAVAKSWSEDIARHISKAGTNFSHERRRSSGTKIRIGYLSCNFCSHPVAHLTADLYGLHNRDEFEIFCYSCGEDDGSYYRKRIAQDCDKFVDLRHLNNIDAAKRVYEDQTDILVDLMGHTQDSRLAISALRPAPVQVSYLGFLGSTGADFLDYIITDRIVTPEEDVPCYSEKFVCLPHCYQMNSRVEMQHPSFARTDFGLPEDGFVFCSFNEPYKIEPVMFDIWMKILRRIPKSVLWLPRKNETAEKNLRQEAEARKVDSERLIFSERLPIDQHLARLKLADLALDTRIYNGGATTSNALWMGVPVITLQGSHFVSRMTASSLSAIGLPELITYNLKEYGALAVRLARNSDELQAIQEKLEKNRLTEPLFDTPRFVRNLEQAYKEMWEIFLAEENPRQIKVTETPYCPLPAPCPANNIADTCFLLMQTCAWQELGAPSAKLDEMTKNALNKGIKSPENPFASLMKNTDPSYNFAVAKSYAADIVRRMSNVKMRFPHDGRRFQRKKIALGYLSGDFCNHAVAHLTLSLFGLHNRDEFEIFCYAYGKNDGSRHREQIQRDCDTFADLSNLNYMDAAKRIYQDHIDILVDLNGHTKGNRMEICALRPAPVQVTYLGFPGTTGADFFDYMITDKIVTPRKHARWYSENFAYMPHCYQVNDHTQAISEKEWKKADFGLPENAFVFCSFNNTYKIEPILFDVWMKILRQVQDSVLWLFGGNSVTEENLKKEAEARGVNAERLVFSEKLPKKDEHLARHRLADLALDTRIYNGHSTTSDALWSGVPVITLRGTHFPSRVSSSILTAIGLPELIADTLDEYEDLAVWLAESSEELQAIRRRLAKNRSAKPLFDTPRFVRNLENAYKEMWNIFLAGEKPRQIEVRETGKSKIKNQKSKLERASSSFQRAVQFHQAGQFQEAGELYKKILEANPDHSDTLHLSGVIAHQTGKKDAAEELIRKAIRISPEDAAYHYNLGCVYQEQGNSDDAISCFEKTLTLKPDYIQAYNNLGVLLQNQDKVEEAISCFQKGLALDLNIAETYNNLGNAFQKQDRTDEAVSCFQKALKIKPDMAETLNNLGNAFRSRGKLAEAVSCLQKALKIRPDYTDACNNMGFVLQSQGKLDQAMSYYQKALDIRPDYADALNNMGYVLQSQGKPDEAISCFQSALKIKPDYANAYFNMGNAMISRSQLDEAINCYDEALQITQNYPFAIAGKADVLMKKGEFEDAYQCLLPLIESETENVAVAGAYTRLAGRFDQRHQAIQLLKRILNSGVTVADEISQIHFDLGYLYDEMGEYDTAFHHYQQANELKPWRFDAKQHENHISSLMAVYDSAQKSDLALAKHGSELPVFIVGMPRSGTTLVEQILASHPRVFGAGELPGIGRIAQHLRVSASAEFSVSEYLNSVTDEVLDEFAHHYLNELREFSGDASRITNKMPQNFLYLGLIWQLFPKARIIHCARDARDIGLSIYFQNFSGAHAYAFDMKNIGAYYNQYERIMRHWRDAFGIIPMLEVRYEELVANQEEISREMVAYLGLEWDDRCLRFHESERAVITASSQQVREPIYTTSTGRWKRYEKYLKPLFDNISY